MNSPIKLLDETLESLKDFQRATVHAVMANFNGNGSQRILVADEVGLGKTIVAKGVIAELLKKHLVDQAISNHNRPTHPQSLRRLQAFHSRNAAWWWSAAFSLRPGYRSSPLRHWPPR